MTCEALKVQIIGKADSVKTNLKFLPSSLALYPLDFQDIWQSSEPVPVDINYSVPSFGARDLVKKLQQLRRSTEILKQKVEERDKQERLSKNLEAKADSVLSLLRDRIRYAHRLY
ncbi:hypothetical protein MACJ_004030 [Theileria orientalis]|uniref:Uncharacterized protein n=1 Tax=Theileria orientalis TaxID=68886 RepID=A0A976SL26_THEOR|nr:hypothetical protein MACJ_004030 [Theileria orientalis]